MSLKKKVQEFAEAYWKDVVAIRRHLHSHPELSFEEFKTMEYISSKLNEWGIKHKTGLVKTGIVGEIVGGKGNSDRLIALRADIDALPILETNEVEYKSKNDGVMHACGHDVHSASLLGTLRILNEVKTEFSGTVRFIFQPGEEKLPGGASLMIKEGVLENPAPNAIYGQHVFPAMEAGKVGFRKGMYMASTDELYVTVRGKGGHAAMPQQYNNPIFMASQMLLKLQEAFMEEGKKQVPKDIPTVLAFGKVVANGATNVIPDEVKIEGTFRTMDEKWRKEAHKMMKSIATELVKELGGECEFDIHNGYPFLKNDEKVTELAMDAARDFLGEANVEEMDIRMTAEDFAFYSQYVPSCFYRLGTANKAEGITAGVHTSNFNIDENALKTGTGLMAWLALAELNKE